MSIELTEKQRNIISMIENGGKTITCPPEIGQYTLLSQLAIERTEKQQKTRIIADSYAMDLLVGCLLSMIDSEKDIIASYSVGSGLNSINLSIGGEVYATISEGSSYQSYLADDDLVLVVDVHDCEFINSPPKTVKHSRLFRLKNADSLQSECDPSLKII